jgi:hypothetical protein
MPISSGIVLNARVVTGRHFLAAKTRCQSIERRKLEPTVTGNTGDWGLAVKVTFHEGLYHVLLKLALEIEDIKRKAQLFGYATRVIDVIQGATAGRKRLTILVDA